MAYILVHINVIGKTEEAGRKNASFGAINLLKKMKMRKGKLRLRQKKIKNNSVISYTVTPDVQFEIINFYADFNIVAKHPLDGNPRLTGVVASGTRDSEKKATGSIACQAVIR